MNKFKFSCRELAHVKLNLNLFIYGEAVDRDEAKRNRGCKARGRSEIEVARRFFLHLNK